MKGTEARREKIREVQKTWGQAIVSQDIDQLMSLYTPNAKLKPTVSNVIRQTPIDIKLYFIGGEKFNDQGFLNRGIRQVFFKESDPLFIGDIAVDVGEYAFELEDGSQIEAHCTFGYQFTDEGKVLIVFQHSSLRVP